MRDVPKDSIGIVEVEVIKRRPPRLTIASVSAMENKNGWLYTDGNS